MLVDVLIFGGGASGLWCLHLFRRAGYHAILLESAALGGGQTIQSQGIIHGGGKYGLRGVRDFAAVRATSQMPDRWRRCLSGASDPSLAGVRVLSQQSYLWFPRGSFIAKAQSFGIMPIFARAGLLASQPEKVAQVNWPEALHGTAESVYVLNEQVISTGSFLETLATVHSDYVFLYDTNATRLNDTCVETAGVKIASRAMVLTAGAGNAELMRSAGILEEIMQRRPLNMVLLRGPLPSLFGHCVIGGKARLTITAPTPGVWQVGGEIAERLAYEDNLKLARRQAQREIQRWMPALDLSRVDIALYSAVRAEGRTPDLRRPSGVQASFVAPRTVAAWPTKLCLVPVLADEVFNLVDNELKSPAGYDHDHLPTWPSPALAAYPWEDAEWFSAV